MNIRIQFLDLTSGEFRLLSATCLSSNLNIPCTASERLPMASVLSCQKKFKHAGPVGSGAVDTQTYTRSLLYARSVPILEGSQTVLGRNSFDYIWARNPKPFPHILCEVR